MLKRLRHRVTDLLTHHLLKAVTKDDVLLITNQGWFFQKHKLTQEEFMQLREEALSIKGSLLWKLINRELRYRATLQRYDQAKTPDDMVFGKAMTYNFDLIEKYIDQVGRL